MGARRGATRAGAAGARGVGAVGALAVLLVLAGCAGSAPPGGEPTAGGPSPSPSDARTTPAVTATPVGPAEVVDAAGCVVREAVAAFGTATGEGLPAASRAGTVPDGFVPVAAVECRLPVTPEGGDPEATALDVVRLEGDLAPLRAQLERPDVPEEPDQACIAMFEAVPVLYLVDGDGRAVRVAWPTDACGFLLDGARASVEALTEVGHTVVALP